MNSDNEDASTVIYYVTMVGMYGSGKSSIIQKLKKNHFVKSYKPTEDKKILKHTIQDNTIEDLEDNTVKISFKDTAGISNTTPSDTTSFLNRKAHIICFVYDYDNNDTYQCIKYLLESNDSLYSTNRIIMVIRNKVDNKQIISDSEQECDEQFREITSINEEIMFIKNFSAKSKSQDKIEKIFIKAINLYRDYYGEQPPPGGKKKSAASKAEAYDDAPKKKSTKSKSSSGSNNNGSNKKRQTKNGKSSKNGKGKGKGRTNKKSEPEEVPQDAGCSCIIL